MKNHLAMLAVLATLALAGCVEAGDQTVSSLDVMTRQKQATSTLSKRTSSLDDQALQEYFRTAPYRNGSFIGNN